MGLSTAVALFTTIFCFNPYFLGNSAWAFMYLFTTINYILVSILIFLEIARGRDIRALSHNAVTLVSILIFLEIARGLACQKIRKK